jgi:hypothetical protein
VRLVALELPSRHLDSYLSAISVAMLLGTSA